MKKITSVVSSMLVAAMILSATGCSFGKQKGVDKATRKEIVEETESFIKAVKEANYKKLSKLIDDKETLECIDFINNTPIISDRFDMIFDLVTFEIDEKSTKVKDDKISINVDYTYVDFSAYEDLSYLEDIIEEVDDDDYVTDTVTVRFDIDADEYVINNADDVLSDIYEDVLDMKMSDLHDMITGGAELIVPETENNNGSSNNQSNSNQNQNPDVEPDTTTESNGNSLDITDETVYGSFYVYTDDFEAYDTDEVVFDVYYDDIPEFNGLEISACIYDENEKYEKYFDLTYKAGKTDKIILSAEIFNLDVLPEGTYIVEVWFNDYDYSDYDTIDIVKDHSELTASFKDCVGYIENNEYINEYFNISVYLGDLDVTEYDDEVFEDHVNEFEAESDESDFTVAVAFGYVANLEGLTIEEIVEQNLIPDMGDDAQSYLNEVINIDGIKAAHVKAYTDVGEYYMEGYIIKEGEMVWAMYMEYSGEDGKAIADCMTESLSPATYPER